MILYLVHNTSLFNDIDDSQRFVRLLILSSLVYGFMILVYPSIGKIEGDYLYKYKTNLWYTYIVDIIVTWIKFKYRKEDEIKRKDNIVKYLKDKNKEIIYEQMMSLHKNNLDDINFPIYKSKKEKMSSN